MAAIKTISETELAIRKAMEAVQLLPVNSSLTNALNMLSLARDSVAEYDRVQLENVDRSQQVLTSGEPVPADRSHIQTNPTTGQQKGYVVLTEAERAKGFVRPVRTTYIHSVCGTVTAMSEAIAETYARDPEFYSGTFCCHCRNHFPIGEDGQFTWEDGSKVGT